MTPLSELVAQARVTLKELVASFWTDQELVDIANQGFKDFWGAIIDLNQEHYLKINVSDVSVGANSEQLVGVPTDTFRVHLIEPLNTVSGSAGSPYTLFRPRDYNSNDFINARMMPAMSPTAGMCIFYALTNEGPPINAPTVLTGPQSSAAFPVRFVYVPTIPKVPLNGTNPIPGESDNAIKAWIIAYARAKEREDRSPDPNWLAIYATEKQNILVRMAPRQTQEPEVVEGLFDGWS
jgi:hypothetical protein